LGVEPKGSRLATPFNFGPEPSARQPVRKLVEEVLQVWPGTWKDLSQADRGPHEARLLSLSIDKASALLGWRPAWDFSTAVRATVTWYHERHAARNPSLVNYACQQIDDYTKAAQEKGITWAVGP
jgi:CDP-glucose 4,6-dehydratase